MRPGWSAAARLTAVSCRNVAGRQLLYAKGPQGAGSKGHRLSALLRAASSDALRGAGTSDEACAVRNKCNATLSPARLHPVTMPDERLQPVIERRLGDIDGEIEVAVDPPTYGVTWLRRSRSQRPGARPHSRPLLRRRPASSQAESLSGQASSLRTGRLWTAGHIHSPGHAGRAPVGRHACDS